MIRRSDALQEALREVADAHRRINAPSAVEGRLRAAVRANSSRGWLRWRIPAAAAAAVLALLVVRGRQPAEEPVTPERSSNENRLAGFVVLPVSFALPPPTATTILTVELRKGDLRQYGIDVPPPVAAELVRADFVVGQDGLARAVRLVSARRSVQ